MPRSGKTFAADLIQQDSQRHRDHGPKNNKRQVIADRVADDGKRSLGTEQEFKITESHPFTAKDPLPYIQPFERQQHSVQRYKIITDQIDSTRKCHQKHQEDLRLQSYGKNWLASQKQSLTENEEHHRTPAEISESCIQYILDHIGESNLGVNDVAASVFLNPIYLNRIFKKEKGCSISQWIIKERMELSSTLLLTTDRPAIEIAYQVGYNNYPYFSTVFKKYFGMTPSQYKENK